LAFKSTISVKYLVAALDQTVSFSEMVKIVAKES